MPIRVGIGASCSEVITRHGFGQPTLWANGHTLRIFGSFFVLVGAYTMIRRDRVRGAILTKGGRPFSPLDIPSQRGTRNGSADMTPELLTPGMFGMGLRAIIGDSCLCHGRPGGGLRRFGASVYTAIYGGVGTAFL